MRFFNFLGTIGLGRTNNIHQNVKIMKKKILARISPASFLPINQSNLSKKHKPCVSYEELIEEENEQTFTNNFIENEEMEEKKQKMDKNWLK